MTHFRLFFLFFLAVVPLADLATPVVPWDDTKIMHTWHGIPVNWETLGHPSAGSTIDLEILLEPGQGGALLDAVSEISNPKHSRYRAFLSKEQVDELIRPSPDTVELVCAWLAHNGIPSSSISRTQGGTSLAVTDLRVTQASELLGASYQLYRNVKSNETIIRTVGYSLPEVLHRHVQTVMPTTCFSSMEVTVQTPHRQTFGPAPAQMQPATEELGTVEARQPPPEPPIVQPWNLRWLYGTVTYVTSRIGPDQNSLVVVTDRLPRQQDLTAFMDEYEKENVNGATFDVVNVGGDPLDMEELPDAKSNVAVQYATAMAYPIPLFVYRTVQNFGAFMQLLDLLENVQPVPRTIGISFNYFLEQQLPQALAEVMCLRFLHFAARGSSVLVASGDNGVGPENCARGLFHVEFPSSCPWVTSVGGTQGLYPEIATPRSGGGFSSYFERQHYQQEAVGAFLHGGDNPDHPGRYNPGGRGYPDISSQAFGCSIFLDGAASVASGTACAVSTAAGIISLLNDYMIRTRPAGENLEDAALGFLNPWLYSDEVRSVKGLNDIVQGSNPGCGTTGFEARKGWDPVTGLGTLNFPRLLLLLEQKRFFALTPTQVPTPGAMVPVPTPS